MAVASAARQSLARSVARYATPAVPRASRFATFPALRIPPPSPPSCSYKLPSRIAPPTARTLHHSARSLDQKRIPEVDAGAAAGAGPSMEIPVTGERTPIGQIQQRLSITFTCSVDQCGHRSTHEFAKRSYTHGIVIVQCPGCKNRHLIADNLSWFTETVEEPKTIEEMIAAKGGKVRRGKVFSDGKDGETIEIEG